MATDREIALEVVIAALLKAARHDKHEILQRAKGLIVGGALDVVGGSADSKSVADSAIREISVHLQPSSFNARLTGRQISSHANEVGEGCITS